MIYFTSDTHFGHRNILKYCNRDFVHIDQHDEFLIKEWNKTVGEEDEVYHLGDFALCSTKYIENVARRLNGKKYIVWGNHDKRMGAYFHNFFQDLGHYHELRVKDEEMDCTQTIVLCHYPIASWNKMHRGSWHLHGHCHGTFKSHDWQARMDVGVDVNNYKPISYEDVKYIMTRKVFKPVDHHGSEETPGDLIIR